MNIKKCAGILLVPFALAVAESRDCQAGSDKIFPDNTKKRMVPADKTSPNFVAIEEHSVKIKKQEKKPKLAAARPNFVTIVLDDMGFSDLGVFGSEIPTPNMDQLAKQGIVLSNFYAAPTSTPSRGMLFTGKDSHPAGTGIMPSMQPLPQQKGKPGYERRLSLDVPAFPELLQEHGYYTMFTGKWDLAGNAATDNPAEVQAHDPFKRGFNVTRAALLPGGGNHYSLDDGTLPMAADRYTENGKSLAKFPREFYSTEYYTDMGIEMLKARDKSKPFYLCLSYTAPHNPLQAPSYLVGKYLDVYAKGWEAIRKERFARQKQLGFWPQKAPFPSVPVNQPVGSSENPNNPSRPHRAWNDPATDQRAAAKRMAVYAAMVDLLDRNIGRLIDYLKESGAYDNTVIFIYSDNGGGFQVFGRPTGGMDDRYENIGNWNSYIGLDQEWVFMVSNAPFATAKGSTREGGWRTPAILHYPKAKVRGVKSDRIVSVMDIAPTILEMAGIKYPETYQGKPNKPMLGLSMAELFQSKLKYDSARQVAFEMSGMTGLRSGDWKMVKELPCSSSEQLFNLKEDPFELHDVAQQHPDVLKSMKAYYAQYAKENGMVDVCAPAAAQ